MNYLELWTLDCKIDECLFIRVGEKRMLQRTIVERSNGMVVIYFDIQDDSLPYLRE